jgi:cytochrome c
MMKFRTIAKLALPMAALAALSACGGAEKTPDAADTTAAAPAADAVPPPTAAVTFASLKGDEVAGEKVFKQCMACHVVTEGQNRVGPSLHAIIGRTAGQVAGFSYSTANKTSGKVWDKETLYTYLEAPQKFMPGTKMAFAGLKKPQDRADVIAYLDTHD